jgi:excisionase family DNA binding protein
VRSGSRSGRCDANVLPVRDVSARPSILSHGAHMSRKPSSVRLPRIMRPADHPLLTVQEAAARLGCSDMTIRRRIAARQFPAVKNGRKSMVPRSFIERLLAQAEAGHTVVVAEAVDEWRANVPHVEGPVPSDQVRQTPSDLNDGTPWATSIQV